jgi:GTP-binding protein Era
MDESTDLPIYQSTNYRSGFVPILGRPNVGKSTLLNSLLGEKVAIVSPKPQTTRTRILGVLTRPDAQMVFLDTPGWHQPLHKLGEYMVEVVRRAVPDADLILFLADLTELPNDEDRSLAELVRGSAAPVLVVGNKADLLHSRPADEALAPYRELLPGADAVVVSALTGQGLGELQEAIVARLPEGPQYYPPDVVTDQPERVIAAEMVREQVLVHTHQEVPHAVAVDVEEFKERDDGTTYIRAVIYVERDSQKGILIGRGGAMLKTIGQDARRELERFVEGKVYLDLWVKVRKNWRKKDDDLRRLGYRT